MVVGGHAVGAYGESRSTKDLDVVVRNSVENSVRVYRAPAAFGAPLTGTTSDDFSDKPTLVHQYGVPPARIDILQRLEGVTLDEAWSRRVQSEEGLEADFISLEDLLSNKSAVGRLQDLADVENLRRVNGLG